MAKKCANIIVHWAAAAAAAATFSFTSLCAFGGSVWSGNGPAGSSTSWSVPQNWSSNLVPAQGDDVIIGTGFNSGTMITLGGPIAVRSLGIDGATNFTLTGDANSTLTIGTGTVNRKPGSTGVHTLATSIHLSEESTNFDIADATGRLSISGNISGGALRKRMAGTLALSGVNSYASTTIQQGTLAASSDAALGAASGTLSISGGAALSITGGNTLNRPVVGSGTFTIETPAGTTWLQGGVHGTGTLVKAGIGRMRYFGAGSNTFAGRIVNTQGQLLTHAAHLGNASVENYGELQFSQTGNFGAYEGVISGTGTFVMGGGVVELKGINTFTGGLTVNDTTLIVTSDANLGAANGTLTLNSPNTVLSIAADFSMTRPIVFNNGTSTIDYVGSVSGLYGPITGPGTFRKTGIGEFEVNTVRTGGLVVERGTVGWAYNGTSAGTGSVSLLKIDGPGAQVDLTNNHLIIDHAPDDSGQTYASVVSMISGGRNGGSWNGVGLISSTARAHAQRNTTLGMLKASDYQAVNGTLSFGGLLADQSSVLIKYTYYGDTDLNGVVNFDDYARIDAGYNGAGTDWFHGDFDYNGGVNFDDYALIDLAFNTQGGSLQQAVDLLNGGAVVIDRPELQVVSDHFTRFGQPYATSFLNAVPEPGLAILGVQASACMFLRRRRMR